MRSISVGQAALVAAIAQVLMGVFYIADNLGPAESLAVLGGAVPSLVWGGFFFTLFRKRTASARTTAWITLIFAILLDTLITYVRAERSVAYWTPFGNQFSLPGWILRLGW